MAKAAVHYADTISLVGQYVCRNTYEVSLADVNPAKGLFPAYVQHELMQRSHGTALLALFNAAIYYPLRRILSPWTLPRKLFEELIVSLLK